MKSRRSAVSSLEYCVMAALILGVCLGVAGILGINLQTLFASFYGVGSSGGSTQPSGPPDLSDQFWAGITNDSTWNLQHSSGDANQNKIYFSSPIQLTSGDPGGLAPDGQSYNFGPGGVSQVGPNMYIIGNNFVNFGNNTPILDSQGKAFYVGDPNSGPLDSQGKKWYPSDPYAPQ